MRRVRATPLLPSLVGAFWERSKRLLARGGGAISGPGREKQHDARARFSFSLAALPHRERLYARLGRENIPPVTSRRRGLRPNVTMRAAS